MVAAVLLLGAVLGLLGYYMGRDSDAEGREPAAKAPRTTSEEGETGRTYEEGLRAGREEGLRAGRREGYERGVEDGSKRMLGGFEFAPATFYVVQFGGSGEGDGLRVIDSELMQPGRSYLLCNTNDLCAR
jgi:hypothetical protein